MHRAFNFCIFGRKLNLTHNGSEAIFKKGNRMAGIIARLFACFRFVYFWPQGSQLQLPYLEL